MTKELNDRLDKLLAGFKSLLDEDYRPENTARDLTLFGLTLDEAKDWMENIPEFAKRIVMSLNPRRPPDKLPVYPIGGWVHSNITYSGG